MTTTIKKPSRNKIYEDKQRAKGLSKCTVWVPDYAADDLKDLSANITEFYLETGEFHKKLIPAMYRDTENGVMGNKSLSEYKTMKRQQLEKELAKLG